MGNQSISVEDEKLRQKTSSLESSHLTRLHQIENATLLKCVANDQSYFIQNKDDQQLRSSSSLLFLEKLFITESQQQYRFLAKYLEKQSMIGSQSQSSQILKIAKIYQQSQKGICSNHYMIRILFQYSDITIRDELRIRSKKKQKNKHLEKSPYFRYEDLCSIMFACISSLYAVEKMRENLNSILKNKLIKDQITFKHFDFLINQYKFNIPFNLDRIIIMPDGTIKVMHPLLLDHDNRAHYSNKFYYSPQKIKDFLIDDGIKGRLFETAIIVLQCALIETPLQMNKIYNGYCVNQNQLNQKIQTAISIYSQLQNLTQEDMKLFILIKKMTKIDPQQRIDLDQCIKEAENLFQLNKKLKQSITQNLNSQRHNFSNDRMSVQELQLIPSYRMTLKSSPLQNSTAQNTAHAKCKFDRKNSSRQTSVGKTLLKEEKQNPQVQISNFDVKHVKQIQNHKNFLKNSKDPFGSLMINNDQQNFFRNNNEECFQSFLGHGSNLYDTQKFNFLDSKFQYGKFYCNPVKNSIIQQRIDSMNSSNKKCNASVSGRELKYKKMLKQSFRNSSSKKDKSQFEPFMPQNYLKSKPSDSVITAQKFMDNEKIYSKYNFIEKSINKNLRESRIKQKYSFMEIKNDQSFHNQDQQNFSKKLNRDPYAFSVQSSYEDKTQSSQNSHLFSTDKKSEVLEKITSFHINQQIKRHRILRRDL